MRRIAMTVMVLLCWAATPATAQSTSCGTSFTFTNQYGVADLYRFRLSTTSGLLIWHADESFFNSNDTQTISLLADDSGDTPHLYPGQVYTLTLDLSGFGVCCGAFSNFSIALSGDLVFTDGTVTKQGFYPPGSLNSLVFQLRRNPTGTSCPTLVDPVDGLLDTQNQGAITTDPAKLALKGTVVSGVSSDGVSRVVVRIPASTLSDQISLRLLQDLSSPSNDVDGDGGLSQIGGLQFQSELPDALPITEPVQGSGRYMAFAVYRAPADFIKGTVPCLTDHCGAADALRTVNLEITQNDSVYVVAITIVRPPVILVHGLNADRSAWDTFLPFVNDARFQITRSNYGGPISGVTDIVPDYQLPDVAGSGQTFSVLNLWPVLGSYLGFEFNAKTVAKDIDDAIKDFRAGARALGNQPVAAAQGDIVAHSMGGVIVRTIPRIGLPNFSYAANYWQGTVHKMITLGTPHLGSPNGRQVLEPQNSCVANLMAATRLPMFLKWAIVESKLVNGGAFDLAGDGTPTGNLSLALKLLRRPADVSLPVAVIAGKATDAQYAGLDGSPQAALITRVCRADSNPNDPDNMVGHYNVVGWPVMMGAHVGNSNPPVTVEDVPSPSDGVVPLASGLDGRASVDFANAPEAANTFPDVHSIGLVWQGFPGPFLQNDVAVSVFGVTNLMNTPKSNAAFDLK